MQADVPQYQRDSHLKLSPVVEFDSQAEKIQDEQIQSDFESILELTLGASETIKGMCSDLKREILQLELASISIIRSQMRRLAIKSKEIENDTIRYKMDISEHQRINIEKFSYDFVAQMRKQFNDFTKKLEASFDIEQSKSALISTASGFLKKQKKALDAKPEKDHLATVESNDLFPPSFKEFSQHQQTAGNNLDAASVASKSITKEFFNIKEQLSAGKTNVARSRPSSANDSRVRKHLQQARGNTPVIKEKEARPQEFDVKALLAAQSHKLLGRTPSKPSMNHFYNPVVDPNRYTKTNLLLYSDSSKRGSHDEMARSQHLQPHSNPSYQQAARDHINQLLQRPSASGSKPIARSTHIGASQRDINFRDQIFEMKQDFSKYLLRRKLL